MKRIVALFLCVILLMGCLTACGGETEQKDTQPVVTIPAEEANALKVLILGHSLGYDAAHMLALIADVEGYESLTVGSLYYGACTLEKHVKFLTDNEKAYDLYTGSTETPNELPATREAVSMLEALEADYWDVIVMQAGVFEIAEDDTYTNGDIQKIQSYVNEHKKNPDAVFAWNMTWAPPEDSYLRDTLNKSNPQDPDSYIAGFKKYAVRNEMYNEVAKCVEKNIVSDETFEFVIPSATVFENALTSYFVERDMYRDYVHASDLARVMTSYVWFCRLTGVEQLTELKLDAIPKKFFRTTPNIYPERVLTDNEKALILEAVNNALKEPLKVTQSQFTEKPADYFPMY